ncbi:hypothetical protein SD77_2720 [Bacillus badius]|uniref:Ribose 5-phosphate isomerase B n=1 Tax=Bacillus badius TaxID=1455 RepID=A0ABR5ARK4_BACBA|nr:hypothetical protein SD77_2720 [Bacillus badius]
MQLLCQPSKQVKPAFFFSLLSHIRETCRIFNDNSRKLDCFYDVFFFFLIFEKYFSKLINRFIH